ncbi:hypothetical protein BVY04_00085 [bacterium M21]|nr:hypothetical protein BVY04_00085 [bacterium M21]
MQLSLDELPAREQQRLAIAVLSHSGIERRQIAGYLDVHEDTVKRWQDKNKNDFTIWDLSHSGRKRIYGADIEDRFIAFYCQTKPFGDTGRWSFRWAESHLGKNGKVVGACPSRSTMQRILNRHGLKPHKNRYFLQITDPDFFPKMERLIELYQNPPKYLFCFDECPGIQILKRLTPDMFPGDEGGMLRWINEFEYIRNGTTDLFAFLDVNTGGIQAEFRKDHKKGTFIEEFRRHVAQYQSGANLNYIMDNLASHCSYDFCQVVAELSTVICPSEVELKSPDQRRQWLQDDNKRISINFTPFHGSWLNMAEIVFRLIGEKVLKDSYGTPDELHKAVGKYIKEWNESWAHPFTWKYNGKGLHEKVVLCFTSILSHSAGKITLQYLGKSSQLMVNMIENNWQEVPLKTWSKLFRVINEQEDVLRRAIKASSQPIVKEKTEDALNQFLHKVKAINQRAGIAA